MLEKALALLGIAQKGGNIALGDEPVGAAAHGGKARLIILASDAAGHTQRRAGSYGAVHGTPVISIDADKSTLGAVFGRTSVAMTALTDIQLARRFLEELDPPERYAETLEAVTKKAEVMARRKKEQQRRNRARGKR